jgi:hypothetical protein
MLWSKKSTGIRRVPAFDAGALVCAMLSCAGAMMLTLINAINRSNTDFFLCVCA